MVDVRRAAIERVRAMGWTSVPADLAAPDPVERVRSLDEVRDRCLSLYACVAVSFGLDRRDAARFVDEHQLGPHLTTTDHAYLAGSHDELAAAYQQAVESLWALAWLLEVVPALDWQSLCADTFIGLFPDPRAPGASGPVDRAVAVRAADDVAVEVDVAFLLHHGHVESRLSGAPAPTGVGEPVVAARRRALEWSVGSEDWDDVSLDT